MAFLPIDLTKVITQSSPASKIPSNGTYFTRFLTGSGRGSVGVINKQNNSIKLARDLIQQDPNYIFHPQNSHQLLYLSNEYDRDVIDTISNDSSHGYKFETKTVHSYSLSILDIFSQILIGTGASRFDLPSQITLNLNTLPSFLKVLNFDPNYQNQLVSAIFPSVDYFKFKDPISKKTIKSQFFMHYVPIYKINGMNPTNHVTIILNLDSHQTSFPSSAPQLDTYLVNLACQNNYTSAQDIQDIELGTTIKQQVKATENGLFSDLASLIANFPDVSSEPDENYQIRRELLANAYHLLKIQDTRRSANDYQTLYDTLFDAFFKTKKYDTYEFNKLINVNTRLSLTRQINLLQHDTKVYQFNPTISQLQTNDKYSPEQLDVIHAIEPYTVVVAGAGSGKSHTLIGRLSYLKQNHVDFHHVLVTSFTNTAAQNIIDRFHSGINSLTNANLFHKIYQANFSHILTNDITLCNLLQMLPSKSKFMQKSPTMNDTRKRLIHCLQKSISTGFIKVDPQNVIDRLVQLFDERFDDAINLLNAVDQTTLLLEPVVVSTLIQRQQNIKYPAELQDLDFILTDESQDTSAFEYVLLLQLAHRNHAQLMIIGDANQTLYEFRNANPRFLNTLERSKVFKTYTMSTNYRSKQDILTFANQLLSVMETNQTAKIQLHANVFAKTDENTFKNHVKFYNLPEIIKQAHNVHTGETNDQAILRETLSHDSQLAAYVKHCLTNHEQMAILAYRNRDTQAIADAVEHIAKTLFPKQPFTVGRTRKLQRRPNTWLSDMITNTKTGLITLSKFKTQLTIYDIKNDLSSRLQTYAKYRNRHTHYRASNGVNPAASKMIDQLIASQAFNSQLARFNRHQLTINQLIGFIQFKLTQAETYYNQTRSLIDGSSENTEWKDADLVISTIHSAKGLEFPHVICYFDETHRESGSQSNLRLFGVALTRAENDELIINKPHRNFDPTSRQVLPTPVSHDADGLTKTPMRTAYARVIDDFHRQQISLTN